MTTKDCRSAPLGGQGFDGIKKDGAAQATHVDPLCPPRSRALAKTRVHTVPFWRNRASKLSERIFYRCRSCCGRMKRQNRGALRPTSNFGAQKDRFEIRGTGVDAVELNVEAQAHEHTIVLRLRMETHSKQVT